MQAIDVRSEQMSKSSSKSDVRGRTVIVRGGGAGFGQATALTLAGHGARLIIFDRIVDRVTETADRIVAAGGGEAAPPTPGAARQESLEFGTRESGVIENLTAR